MSRLTAMHPGRATLALTADSETPSAIQRQVVGFAIACIWLLMLVSVSPPNRHPTVATGILDSWAMGKIALRGVVFCVLSFLLIRQWNTPRRRFVLRALAPWLLFCGWAITSASWSAIKNVTIGQAGSLSILLMVAATVAMSTDKLLAERLLKQLVWALLVACSGLLVARFAVPEWHSLGRSSSGLLHATNGAATASIGCVMLIAIRLLYGWRWSRNLFVPAISIFAATLIVAQSRTALAVTCVVTAGLVVCLMAPQWRALVIATVGIGGAIYLAADVSLGITESLTDLIATYSRRGQTTAQMAKLSGREEMWNTMWKSFLESPWIGHGYFVSSAKGQLYVWFGWSNWTAHNFWLQILVSSGVVGAVIMAWALIRLAYRLIRSAIQGDIDRRMAALIGTLLIWQVGWGINNESFVGPVQPESVVFFVVLGITVGHFAAAALRNRPLAQPTFCPQVSRAAFRGSAQ